MSETRRFAVLDGTRRVDVVVPASAPLSVALSQVGLDRDGGRLPVIADGRPTDLNGPASQLDDGALLAAVDPGVEPPGPVHRRATRSLHRIAGWYVQIAVGVIAVVFAFAYPHSSYRVLSAAVLGASAVVGAVIAVRHRAEDEAKVARLVGPAALGTAAATLVSPLGHIGTVHLLVVLSAVSAVALLTLALVTDPKEHSGPAMATVALILAVVAAIWGLALGFGWKGQVAASVIVGAVPLGLRALPTLLLDVPDGYFVDFEKFMDARWSVRGTVPQPPAGVDGPGIARQVQAAITARIAGTVVLSLVGTVALPIALPFGGNPGSILVGVGQIILVVGYASAMTMLGRSAGVRHLHWAPRLSAAVAVLVGVQLMVHTVPSGHLPVVALIAVAAGLGAAGLAVPVGRGASSLVLSRIGDWTEALFVALSLPAGLIAGNIIDSVRSMIG